MQNQTLPKSQRNMIVAVMIVSAFVAILNQTLLNTALPHIMKGLHITENTSQWSVTGFMLVNGVMIPLTAFLMDKIKTRPLFLMAMGIFNWFYCSGFSTYFSYINVSSCNPSYWCGSDYAINAIYIIYAISKG